MGITGGVNSSLYELDPNTGAVIRHIGSTGIPNVAGFAVHPTTGQIFVHQNRLPHDDGLLHSFDPVTMTSTLVGETNMSVDDLAFASDGTLYGKMELHDGSFDSQTVYQLVTLKTSNGRGTIVGNSPLLTINNGLAFNTNGDLFLKGIVQVPNSTGSFDYHSEIYQVDPATGEQTFKVRLHDAIGGIGVDTYPSNSLAFDGLNQAFTIQRYYSTTSTTSAPTFQSAFLQRIDLTTGAVSTIGGDLGLEFTGLAFTNSLTAVPEPSSTIAIIVVAGVIGARRRRAS